MFKDKPKSGLQEVLDSSDEARSASSSAQLDGILAKTLVSSFQRKGNHRCFLSFFVLHHPYAMDEKR